MKLKDLRSNPQNPRTLKDTSFKKLLNKILVYPRLLEKNKITFDSEQQNVILGGNMRFKTLKYICSTYRPDNIETAIKTAQNALNIDSKDLLKNSVSVFSELIETETLPKSWTQDAKGLSEEEKNAFVIIDNVSDGDWDFDVLANGWDIELSEWGLVDWGNDTEAEDTDFDDEHLNAKEDDYKEPENLKVDVVLGDLIEIGQHRLLCGDSTNPDHVAKLMNGEKADMVFTDPPYNISFSGSMSNTTKNGIMVKHKGANQKHDIIKNDAMSDDYFYIFMLEALKQIKINCKGGFYICFGSQTLNQLLQPFLDLKLKYKSIIIWVKNQATLSGKDFKSRYEPIIYGRFNDDFFGERFKEEDVWEFQRTLKNDLHPTMKPIPLISKAIIKSSQNGNIVLDLFLGSGSTMVAAHQLNRKCYGMELEPKYCQVIINRMQKLDPSLTVKINGKEYKTETPF